MLSVKFVVHIVLFVVVFHYHYKERKRNIIFFSHLYFYETFITKVSNDNHVIVTHSLHGLLNTLKPTLLSQLKRYG